MATLKNDINKTTAKWAIDSVWHALENLSHRTVFAENRWHELNLATERAERDHRRLMPGSWKAHHPRAVSVATAARYFSAMAPFRDFEAPKSWADVVSIRTDWAIGHALREWWNEKGCWHIFSEDTLKKPVEILLAIDYGDHLVR